jgi:DNA ligase (NAD+)
MGIRYVGETVAKKLASHFKTIDHLMNANYLELVLVEEIGQKIAESIVNYFALEKNLKLIERLRESGVRLKVGKEGIILISNRLDQKSFVISGVFTRFSRDEIKHFIEENGGRNVSAVSSKTDYIIAGADMGPKKLEKAKELGITIISEEEFIKMIG